MTTRTLIAAAIAVVGTIASFSITASPAHAQAPVQRGYVATLTTGVAKPVSTMLGDAPWDCAGTSCSAPADGARPLNSCVRVAKKFGPVAQFATVKGELTAEELKTCNGA